MQTVWADPFPSSGRRRLWLALLMVSFLACATTGCGRHPKAQSPPPTVSPGPGDTGADTVDQVDTVDQADAVDQVGNADDVDKVDDGGEVEEGVASWYGHPYHGRRTANGEVYNMNDQTAAHRTLPFDTWVKVVNLDNGKSTTVRINDRGPFVKGRIIDLSLSAAKEIDMVDKGTVPVRMTVLKSGPLTAPDLYTVQVGAFQVEENARRLVSLLAKAYQSVFVENVGSVHRVRVGRFKTMGEANQLADRLRGEPGVESAMVVRLD